MDTAVETAIPKQRLAPDEPRPGQIEHAARLMWRLWAHDPDTAAELIGGLHEMGRVRLGRVVDNLMWTLANQPRRPGADQMQRIRLLWSRKLAKPIDEAAERHLAQLTRQQAQQLIQRLGAVPDRKPV